MATKTALNVETLLKAKDPAATVAKATFEEGLAVLDALVQGVEGGTLTLDDAVRSYERGTVLLQHLKTKLDAAEKKLQVLDGGGVEGVSADGGSGEPA